MRICVGLDGIVENVVEAESVLDVASGYPGYDIFVDPTGSTNVGSPYDPEDVVVDAMDVVVFKVLFRMANDIRALQGQPNLTVAQFKNFVKGLI